MSVSGYFAEPKWDPLCAVGSHRGDRLNAQICISIFSASIVPAKPRLAVILWKSNYTHELVMESGTFAVTLLTAEQSDLVVPLGLETGRDGDKLGGLATDLMGADPCFPGGAGVLGCEVISHLDLGDSTLFAAAVTGERDADREPVTWADAQSRLPEDVLARYKAKFEHDARWAEQRLFWSR
jgi:flavin reductase (DIM6/NTAB) family NADH-FMN oxidoreductase RutF